MSLINEALKKAQKQRTGDTPSLTSMPGVGGESAERIARRGRSGGLNAMLVWIGVGIVALAGVIVGTVLIMRSPAPAIPPAAPVATTAPVTPPVVAPKPVEPAPAPVIVTPPPATPASNSAPVVLAPATPSSAPPKTMPAATTPLATTVILTPAEPPKPAEVAPIQLAPEPPKPAAPAAAAARKLDPRAINFINSIRVAGIRAAATDSKVLMNDRVYRIGDIVEAEMGLKLTGITPSSLTFEDENGARFTRNF